MYLPVNAYCIPNSPTDSLHSATYITGTGGALSGDRTVRAWSWPLTSIWCQGFECIEIYLHAPYSPSHCANFTFKTFYVLSADCMKWTHNGEFSSGSVLFFGTTEILTKSGIVDLHQKFVEFIFGKYRSTTPSTLHETKIEPSTFTQNVHEMSVHKSTDATFIWNVLPYRVYLRE